MPRPSTLVIVSGLGVCLALPTACANLLGIGEPHTAPDSGLGPDGLDASVYPDGGHGGGDASTPDTFVVVPVDAANCESETPSALHGLFVSEGGSGDPACGAKDTPCGSIGAALARAQSQGFGDATIYVSTGRYRESLAIHDGAGLVLQGGWANKAGAWSRLCDPLRASAVILESSTDTGLTVESFKGNVTLDTLTIEVGFSQPPGSSQSLYGIFVGPSSTFTLEARDVSVFVAGAGAGGIGAVGSAGVDSQANCTGGDGAAGQDGSPGAPGTAGTFSASGYAAGGSGGNGTAGGNGVGTPGFPGAACGPNQCYTGCDTVSGGTGGPVGCLATSYYPAGAIRGADGTNGCGGQGGGPGGGGTGGGSSIGVYAWDANVHLVRGSVTAGPGGAGGAGGGGGPGAIGRPGSPGAPASCTVSCVVVGQTCSLAGGALVSFPGGGGGTPGGTGGLGGTGGGGAGGDSYAVFRNVGAVVTVDGATLKHDRPGDGAGGALPGTSADIGSIP